VGKAFKTSAEIKTWLDTAAREGLSVIALRKRIRQYRAGPTKPDGGPAPAGGAAPFFLLRELRAVGRFVKNHPEVWREWSPATCELALSEMQPVVDFLAELNARAERRERLAKAS